MILRRSKRLGIEKWFCVTALTLLMHSWSIWAWPFIIDERWWKRIFQVFKIVSRQILICHLWRALIHVVTIVLLNVQKLVIAILLRLLIRHTCCIVSESCDIYVYFFGHQHRFSSQPTYVILLSPISFIHVKTTELVLPAQLHHYPTVFRVLFATHLLTLFSYHFVSELSGSHISATASLNNINFSDSLFRSHFGDVEVGEVTRIGLCLTQSFHLEAVSLTFSLFA